MTDTNLLPEVLSAAVRRITGGAADQPRPPQADLSDRIQDAMLSATSVAAQGPTQVLGAAPTGLGKSLAYLAPALLAAAERGERTVISTESLSLQAQVVDRDLPLIAHAVEDVTGSLPTGAVLKGWGNYVCAATVSATIEEISDVEATTPEQLASLLPGLQRLTEFATGRKGIIGKATVRAFLQGRTPTVRESVRATKDAHVLIGTEKVPALPLFRLLEQTCATNDPAHHDIHHLDVTADLWVHASITASGCPGTANCNFGEVCAPAASRKVAADADVLVTNHKLLAIQATTGAPVVLGSKRFGMIDHLVVDEAHELPRIVRDTGAISVSGQRIRSLSKRINRIVVDSSAGDDGFAVAESVDHVLAQYIAARGGRGSAVVNLTENDMPLQDVTELIIEWAKSARGNLPDPATISRHAEAAKVRHLASDLTELIGNVGSANKTEIGTARWLDAENLAVKMSPIDVGPMLRANLFKATAHEQWIDDGLIEDHRLDLDGSYPVSVTMVSATLPDGFARQAGMSVAPVVYDSPFEVAFAASALFVPAINADDLAALTGLGGRFVTGQHAAWAAPKIAELVLANDGSALVLATTKTAGIAYVEHLRAALRTAGANHITVHSQWDGVPVRQALDDWRTDHHSVLVGTRSLMTGVDAPGQTCSLVIIDRIPRTAGNPVDDARVASIMASSGMSKWTADELVYVSDAKLLLQQAAGRLIRRATDTGMIAVLDPRLLGGTAIAQKANIRQTYLSALTHMQHKLRFMDEATTWLIEHRTGFEAA
ncbi:ATP-dependent DNA helicase DinG [Yimella lutea]|uniref:ATP-dependent DNA helicase DinG n=1 Tax=Yimella lutea TaxID=587872 RepID=A0A542EHA9_9MICO|nr:helicase C-terminal domain-containing protein [Yimella lutea]TQJ14709.1 ATP-dependent DNA helicase DinG [Yimella lutea]